MNQPHSRRASQKCWLRIDMAPIAAAAVLLGFGASAGRACPFCSQQGKTLVENVQEAALVLHGQLSNAKLNPNAGPDDPDGSTDLLMKTVIKGHKAIEGKQKFTLPRFVAGAEKDPSDFILFADVKNGKIDPYRGIPLENEDLPKYLQGAVKAADAKPAEKLGFFFKYLDHKDVNISGDAYKEFAKAPYAEVVAAAKTYDPAKIVGWLENKNTPSYQLGLLGCLLGVSGRPQDAKFLRKIMESPEIRPLTGIDGLLGGYCVLDPKEGPDYVLQMLCNPANDFNLRYAALRAVRFLMTEMPACQKKLHEGLAKAIYIADSSDLIIDELRRSKVWEPVNEVLGLYGKKDFDLVVVRRSIIRYALQCPSPKAKEFIADLTKKDPQLVSDVQEILKFEEIQVAPPAAPPAAKAAG